MKLLSIILSIVAAATFAEAAGTIRLGVPQINGTGCPDGSASVAISPDQQSLSVLFSAYTAEAGNTTGRRVDRRSCNMAIPVSIPQGYSVSLISVDYRGFNAVPAGGYTRFDVEYFWAGIRGPRFTRQFNGPQADTFNIGHDLLASAMVWSRCGEDVILRVNSSAMAMANSRMDQTMMIVDSADVSAGIIYHLQWRSCR